MNLHEYQGKSILKKYGVQVPYGIVAHTPDEAVEAARAVTRETGSEKWAVKAQIHAGGRGKGGGVKIAKTLDEVRQYASQIIGMRLVTPQTKKEGKLVQKALIEQNIYYDGPSPIHEIYMSILLNRRIGRYMLLYSPKGGMDIEKVAEESPDLIFTEEIDPKTGILPFQARKIAFNLGLKDNAFREMTAFATALFKAFEGSDASLFEINPVVKTSDDKIFAADSKVVVDNNALYRHADIQQMRDLAEEDPNEIEASRYHLNYVQLDGNVGCMVNGAGLAMATMDVIKLSGGDPANFLDVGGGAKAENVEGGFRIILKDPKVKGILVNIFGGIVRCDRIANGIVEAYKNIGDVNVPIIVRLQGTNAEEGKQIIDRSGLKVHSAVTLQDAADMVAKLLK